MDFERRLRHLFSSNALAESRCGIMVVGIDRGCLVVRSETGFMLARLYSRYWDGRMMSSALFTTAEPRALLTVMDGVALSAFDLLWIGEFRCREAYSTDIRAPDEFERGCAHAWSPAELPDGRVFAVTPSGLMRLLIRREEEGIMTVQFAPTVAWRHSGIIQVVAVGPSLLVAALDLVVLTLRVAADDGVKSAVCVPQGLAGPLDGLVSLGTGGCVAISRHDRGVEVWDAERSVLRSVVGSRVRLYRLTCLPNGTLAGILEKIKAAWEYDVPSSEVAFFDPTTGAEIDRLVLWEGERVYWMCATARGELAMSYDHSGRPGTGRVALFSLAWRRRRAAVCAWVTLRRV